MIETTPMPQEPTLRPPKPSYGGCDDDVLVAWATVGDLEAFDELALRYRPGLVLVARRVSGNRELAEDAVQDGLLAAFKALPQLDDPSRFAAWLGAIIRNRARTLSRREGAIVSHALSELDRVLLCRLTSVRSAWADPLSTDLERAFADLPESTGELVRLHYLEGWSSVRLADVFALPLSTVKWRLLDGRRRLRRHLENWSE